MSLSEIARILKLYTGRILIIAVVCALVGLVGAKAMSIVNPQYVATSTVVVTGGTFSAVTGLGNSAASDASQGGTKVEATASSTNNTITFEAQGKSQTAAIDAANQAANKLAENAKGQEVAKNATVTSANSAKNAHMGVAKCALAGLVVGLFLAIAFYLLQAAQKRSVFSAESVEEAGFKFLGNISSDAAFARIAVANFQFSGKDEEVLARRVLLQPTNSKVDVMGVMQMLFPQANAVGVELMAAAPLQESVNTLYDAQQADAVIVVVEEAVSTHAEIEELAREFSIANLHAGGFVYVPQTKAKKVKRTSQKTISTTPKRARHSS